MSEYSEIIKETNRILWEMKRLEASFPFINPFKYYKLKNELEIVNERAIKYFKYKL